MEFSNLTPTVERTKNTSLSKGNLILVSEIQIFNKRLKKNIERGSPIERQPTSTQTRVEWTPICVQVWRDIFETSDTDYIAEPRALSLCDVRFFSENFTAGIENAGKMTSRHLTISNINSSRENTVIHLSTIP